MSFIKRPVCLATALAALCVSTWSGCAGARRVLPWQGWWVGAGPHYFRGTQTNSGRERYSSWFGDTDGRVFYFGLSPFIEASKHCEAEGGTLCALADLAAPGDHLIGRFDLQEERFLPPLLVRPSDPAAPSSVWDVLVHSNGRIYYTTFWDEFGSVRPDGTDVRHYAGAGVGLNELWEGPDGEIYVTRYLGDAPGVAVFGPDGVLRRDLPIKQEPGTRICPKSIAVDPTTRDIWINSDIFHDDGSPVTFDAFHLSPTGEILDRIVEPVLVFMSFDRGGRGWFVDDDGGHWILRIVEPTGHTIPIDLGTHSPLNVIQDIKHHGKVTLLATWSQSVYVVTSLPDGTFEARILPAAAQECPGSVAQGFTAVSSANGTVYETVSCDITILRVGNVGAAQTL